MVQDLARLLPGGGRSPDERRLAGLARDVADRGEKRAADAPAAIPGEDRDAAPKAVELGRIHVHATDAGGADGGLIERGQEAAAARIDRVGPPDLVDARRLVGGHDRDDAGELGEVVVRGRGADPQHQPPVIGDGSATTETGAEARAAAAMRRPVVTAPSLADETSAAYLAMTPPR